MKKFVAFCLLCVIFILFLNNNRLTVFASNNEQINFIYNNRIFTYNLQENIKTSNIFEIDNQINKYKRFGSNIERKNLLKYMLGIGFDKDIALEYIFPNLNKYITKISKNIFTPPKNATLKINSNSNSAFNITKEKIGIEIDKFKIYDLIYSNFITNQPMDIIVPTKKLQPDILSADFKKYSNLRADFSTNIATSSSDRKHNIKNALNRLNKVEIMPNQVFSFNKTIGKRTSENGYRQAKIIVNNEFVDGIGGGVCQVSSTLYNAALLSGLEIIEANKHSKQVGYVKFGFDAMVNFGSSDLKFKNNTSEKITIISNYSPTNLRIRLYGQSLENTEYKLSNEILNTTEPIEEIQYDVNQEHLDKVEYEDEYFYYKKGSKGMEIKSYREVYENGNLKRKELLRHDKFKVENSVKIYGIKKRTEQSVQ